jgi:hypothetical protein
MQSVGEERNAYRSLFLRLVQCGTKGKCPCFYCKDFCLTLFKCSFMLMPVLNSTLESVPCQSNKMGQSWQCRRLNHDQSLLGLVCAKLVKVFLAASLQEETLQTET